MKVSTDLLQLREVVFLGSVDGPALVQHMLDTLDLPQQVEYLQIPLHNVGSHDRVDGLVNLIVQLEDIPPIATGTLFHQVHIQSRQELMVVSVR